MPNRQERIAIFEGTQALYESSDQLQKAIPASRAGQRIYWEGDVIKYGAPRLRSLPK